MKYDTFKERMLYKCLLSHVEYLESYSQDICELDGSYLEEMRESLQAQIKFLEALALDKGKQS